MKLPKSIPLIAFTWLALASGGAQAATICTTVTDPSNCVYASMDLGRSTTDVTAYGTNEGKTGVMGEPVEGNGVVLAVSGTPDNNSVLTLELEEEVNTSLWVFSGETALDMRFELFVSGNGTDWGDAIVSDLSEGGRYFFENNNEPISIEGKGDVKFVQLVSFKAYTGCAFVSGPCKEYTTAMQVNGVAGKSASASAVPVPAAVWLFGSGLLGLIAAGRRRK